MLFKNGRQDAWVGKECLKVLTQPGHVYVRSSGHKRLRQGSVMVVLSPAWWYRTLWEETYKTGNWTLHSRASLSEPVQVGVPWVRSQGMGFSPWGRGRVRLEASRCQGHKLMVGEGIMPFRQPEAKASFADTLGLRC